MLPLDVQLGCTHQTPLWKTTSVDSMFTRFDSPITVITPRVCA